MAVPDPVRTAIVLPGGDDPGAELIHSRPGDLVIAADSGLDHAVSHGLKVDVVIGDMDSAAPSSFQTHQGEVVPYPTSKDATDFELALNLAKDRGATNIEVVGGGGGGRFDHFLGNAVTITSPKYREIEVRWHLPGSLTTVVWKHAVLQGHPGDLVTLLSAAGDTHGVTINGVEWPLDNVVLRQGSTWGVSNRLVSHQAEVSISSGTLLAIQSADDTD